MDDRPGDRGFPRAVDPAPVDGTNTVSFHGGTGYHVASLFEHEKAMSSQKNRDKSVLPVSCSDEEVAEYLRSHPDFFERHPDVLSRLNIAHQTAGAVSLIERQVAVLRQEARELRQKIRELVDIARENDALMARLHKLSIALLEADCRDSFIELLSERLEQDFEADMVAVRLLVAPECLCGRPELITRDAEGLELFESILARRKPVCGRFNRQQREFLFGERAGQVGSVALVPLFDMESRGLVAIASSDAERFRAGMSTVFLGYLGEVVSAVLKRVV